MLLTKEVEVKLSSYNVKRYEKLGYKIPMRMSKVKNKGLVYDLGSYITVKIEDVPLNSDVEVKVLCDYCKTEVFTQSYLVYNKGFKNVKKSACKKCVNLKIEEANMLIYGVSHGIKTEEVQEKRRNTCLDKYGTVALMSLPEIRQKAIDSCILKYGVPSYTQTDEYIKKFTSTCFKNLGTQYPTQNQKVREKVAQSFYFHSSQKTSKQQRYLHNLYGGELNYPVSYYSLDICFPKEKLCIEYDGGGHFLNVMSGRETEQEYNQKEIVRNNVIKREGYKQMRIISLKDFLPSDGILLQMLEYAKKYFSDFPNRSWIQFDIDSSTVCNAEQKEGVFFNYGKLRRIKETA